MDVKFIRESPEGDASTTGYFKSTASILTNPTQIGGQLEDAISQLDTRAGTFQTEKSGWKVNCVDNLRICTADYDPIGGSSFIPTPGWIANKHCTVNIKNNTDNQCFLYSVLAVSHPQKGHADRVSHYTPYFKELNVDGLNFPITIEQIPIFEKNNPDYAVN